MSEAIKIAVGTSMIHQVFVRLVPFVARPLCALRALRGKPFVLFVAQTIVIIVTFVAESSVFFVAMGFA